MPERAVIRNPILRGLQPGPVDRARRRRLLRRHLDLRVVPGRADPPLARPGALAPPDPAPDAGEPARHAGRPRLLRRVGAVPHPRGRPLLPHLYGREALRPHHRGRGVRGLAARLPQLPGHQSPHRRRLVGSRLPQQQRVRSLAVPRRRRAEVPREPALGPSPGAEPLRRHRAAGVLAGGAPAGRRAARHLRGHAAGPHRGAAPLQARRLLLPDHGRGRDGLGPRGHDGARARADRALRAAPRRVRADARGTGPTPPCSAPAMPTSSRRRPARPTWCTSAAGRSGTAAAARSAARPRSCGCSGARTAGCGRRTAPGSPSSRSRARMSPRTRSRRPRPDPISTAARCRSSSSGCARRSRRSSSA